MTIAGASKLYSNILNQYKGRDLSVGSMIAGYDEFVCIRFSCFFAFSLNYSFYILYMVV